MIRPQLFLALISLLASISAATAQTPIIENDVALMQLRRELPKGWRVSFDEDRLIIKKGITLTGVRTDEAKAKDAEREARLIKNPPMNYQMPSPPAERVELSSLEFTVEGVSAYVSPEARDKALAQIDSIGELIYQLDKKYGVKYPEPKKPKKNAPRRKGPGGGFKFIEFPSPEAEKAYYEEKEALEAIQKVIDYPNYYSDRYSYYKVNRVRLDENYRWSPGSIETEVSEVSQLIDKYIQNYGVIVGHSWRNR